MSDDHHTNEEARVERPPDGLPHHEDEEEEEGMFLGSVDGEEDEVGRKGGGGGVGGLEEGGVKDEEGGGGGGTREGSDSGVEANERCTGGANDGYNSGLESLASDHIPASCESSLISYSGLDGSNQDEEEDDLEDEAAAAGLALDVTLTEGSPPGSRDEGSHSLCLPLSEGCAPVLPGLGSGPASLPLGGSTGGRQHRGGRGVRLDRGQAGERKRRPESPGAEKGLPPGASRSRPTAPRPPRTPGGASQQQGGSNGEGDRSTSRTSSSSSGCTRSTSRRQYAATSATPGSNSTPTSASAAARAAAAAQAAARGSRGSSRGPGGRGCSAERGSTPGPKASASASEGRRARDASLPASRKGAAGRPPSASSSSATSSSTKEFRRGAPTEDDGRWPSSSIRSRRAEAAAADRLSRRTPSATRDTPPPPSLESKASALEKYATLPRRRQHEAKRGTLASVLAAAAANTKTPPSASSTGHHHHGASSSSSGRSVSVSREPSLNRAASLRRQRVAAATSAMTSSMTSAGYRSDADDGGGGKGGRGGGRGGVGGTGGKSLPAYPRRRRPVTIYHEASVQTTLTKRDVERALQDSKESRKARRKTTGSISTSKTSCDCEVQASGLDALRVDASTCTEETMSSSVSKEDMEGLEAERQVLSEQLMKLTEAHTRLEAEYMRQSQRLSELEGEQGVLAAEKLEAERKLKESMRRVAQLLHGSTAEPARGSTPPGPPEVTITPGDGDSSLDELERHLLASGQVLSNQQHEIGGLQKICRNLQKDLDKSFSIQKVLKRQLHEMEAESAEMQEFLLAEKSTLADSLRDSETEMANLQERLSRQEEECKHLVRISEQRRQENLALQARLTGVERRGRELLLQQGAAVSGASVALSGLSSRLDGLVEQLVAGYGISEQELEDVIFHNEAYTQSSSVEASPEKKRTVPADGTMAPHASTAPHPQRPSRRRSPASPGAGASFVSAVISAIKSAAAPFSYRASTTTPQQRHDVSSSSEPTAPAQGDESEIVDEPPSEECGLTLSLEECTLPPPPPGRLAGSESLQNLSRAIMQRQVTENEEEEDSLPLSPPHTSPLSSSSSPSEDVTADGGASSAAKGVTGASEGQSNPLTPPPNSGADSLVDQVIEVDNLLTKLLKVLRIIQMENDSYMEEMNEERAHLSDRVRSEEKKNIKAHDQIKNWEEMGAILRSELSEALVTLQNRTMELEEARIQLSKLQEEASLPDRLNEKDHVNELSKKYAVSNKLLADNWRQALTEVRRQYVAIDNALETLHSVQGVVLQCPPLAKLQQDLEEANFLSVSSPVIGLDTDPNANAALPDSISPDGNDIQKNGVKDDGLNGRA
ncbi:pneumococcal serine-rich repeat protein [Ischnura elegans]|uniref:pneumococcal serine-rich repeat protein n=1 Tax=Ischnura elegans TaxID=197161 RepID=UPI001ED8B143|nr:pneumococcal serine-rich repeat protein [Ischnura elegans]